MGRVEPLEQDLTNLTELVSELASKNALLEDQIAVVSELQGRLDAIALWAGENGYVPAPPALIWATPDPTGDRVLVLERAGQLAEGEVVFASGGAPVEAFTSGVGVPAKTP